MPFHGAYPHEMQSDFERHRAALWLGCRPRPSGVLSLQKMPWTAVIFLRSALVYHCSYATVPPVALNYCID